MISVSTRYRDIAMLNGCRVLDLTTERGLLCGQILGDLGADVIKVEPPGGSPVRALKPFFADEPARSARFIGGRTIATSAVSRSISKPSEGRDLLRQLAAKADLLIESDNPGRSGHPRTWLSRSERASTRRWFTFRSRPSDRMARRLRYADSDLIVMAASGVLILYGDEDRAPIRMSVPQAYLHACADAAALP